jgi:2'-5' RNA ligase
MADSRWAMADSRWAMADSRYPIADMRLFVAVQLSDAVVAAAQDVAAALERRLKKQLDARWVSPANMHLTVRFIGNAADEVAPAVLAALRPALPVAPFVVELGGCGVFPPSGPPRVIWIGLSQGLPSLRAMHEEFNRRLAPLGFEPERRPFSAHLTLARVKDAPKSARAAVEHALETVQPTRIQCRVDAATVFQSRLSPTGAEYAALLDVPCTG